MKMEYKHGWYNVRVAGLKLEVTCFDGNHVFCEDLRTQDYGQASQYCRDKIEAAA